MNRSISKLALTVLGSAMLIGCSSNEYNPPAEPTQLAAAAAAEQFPVNLQAEDNPKLTAVVNTMGNQLTIRNFGDQALTNFDLWVNQVYVLHVDRLDPNSARVVNFSDLYNHGGNSLANAPAGTIRKVQIATHDGRESKVYNVQGPQVAG